MKKPYLFALLIVALAALYSCSKIDSPVQPQADSPATAQTNRTDALMPADDQLVQAATQNFAALLTGDEEVPPVATDAFGAAAFHFARGSDQLAFRLSVRSIDNVLMAHIHLAAPGVNGPVVLWLYPDAPPPVLIPGEFNGVLASRVVTSANLVGPLAGMTLADLMNEMANGNAYVNVHTSQFPGGEIRGQIFMDRPSAPVLAADDESIR